MLATIVTGMGKEKGLRLFRDMVSRNGMSVRKGQKLLVNFAASGEVPLALKRFLFMIWVAVVLVFQLSFLTMTDEEVVKQ